jgi:hypothetical protein
MRTERDRSVRVEISSSGLETGALGRCVRAVGAEQGLPRPDRVTASQCGPGCHEPPVSCSKTGRAVTVS